MTSMSPLLISLFAVLAGLFLLLPAIQFVAVFVVLLRERVEAPHLSRRGDTPVLTAPQAAAREELAALGFECIAALDLALGSERIPNLIFRHRQEPVYAWLNLTAVWFCAYPTSFYSLAADGTLLVTLNRTGWLGFATPGSAVDEAAVDTLQAHWEAHLARLGQQALSTPDDESMMARMQQYSDAVFARWLGEGLLEPRGAAHVWTLRGAWTITRRWFAVRRLLVRPFACAAASPPHAPGLMVEYHAREEQRRAQQVSRPGVNLALLVLSMLVFVFAWGVVFDWQQAFALVLVLLIHEAGHAAAMWCFGQRDMSVFFVPFLGAMVTARERDLRAWQRAVILLAGPMPGLIAGMVALFMLPPVPMPGHGPDMKTLALMAVAVNLFNLLPMAPLDGGRLLELALFSGRPRLRFTFSVVSVAAFSAFAVFFESALTWLLVALLARGLQTHWRVMQLERAAGGVQEPIEGMYARAHASQPRANFLTLLPVVTTTLASLRARPARWWEAAPIVIVLLALWSGAVALALMPGMGVAWQRDTPDARSIAEQAFDTAFATTFDEEGEERPRAVWLAELQTLAADLPPTDPRHVDLAWERLRDTAPDAQSAARLALIAAGRDGYVYDRRGQIAEYLEAQYLALRQLPPAARIVPLQSAIAEVLAVAPTEIRATVDAELRLAETFDQAGDASAAAARLGELRERLARRDDCRCELPQVVDTQAWFHLAHGAAPAALALLEQSPYAARLERANDFLAETYAWALLEDGQIEAGLARMRLAAGDGGMTDRLRRLLFDAPRYLRPELAHALRLAGRGDEALAGLSAGQKRWWLCRPTGTDDSADNYLMEPWQALRAQRLAESAQALCAAAGAGNGALTAD